MREVQRKLERWGKGALAAAGKMAEHPKLMRRGRETGRSSCVCVHHARFTHAPTTARVCAQRGCVPAVDPRGQRQQRPEQEQQERRREESRALQPSAATDASIDW